MLRDNHSEFWRIFYDEMCSLDAWKCWFEKLTRKKKMHMTWHWDSLRHITSTILSRKHLISHLCINSYPKQKCLHQSCFNPIFQKLKRLIKSPIIYLVLIKLKVHLMVSITAHWKRQWTWKVAQVNNILTVIIISSQCWSFFFSKVWVPAR